MTEESKYIINMSLELIDLSTPKEYSNSQSSSSDSDVKFIEQKCSNLSALHESLYIWATKRDIETKATRSTDVLNIDYNLASLDKYSIQFLSPGGHLEDKIIDSYTHILNKREYAVAIAEGRRMKKFCFTIWPMTNCYNEVVNQVIFNESLDGLCSEWLNMFKMPYLGEDWKMVLEAEHLFFPLVVKCGDVGHWVVFDLHLDEKKLYYFNTLNPVNAWPDMKLVLERFWAKMWTALSNLCFEHASDKYKSHFEGPFYVEYTPFIHQPDSNCCGIMILMFMEFWDGKFPGKVAEEIKDLKLVEKLRKKICYDLLMQDENKCKEFVMKKVETVKKPPIVKRQSDDAEDDQPKKRGRKPKNDNSKTSGSESEKEQGLPKTGKRKSDDAEDDQQNIQPKKRGRKPKNDNSKTSGSESEKKQGLPKTGKRKSDDAEDDQQNIQPKKRGRKPKNDNSKTSGSESEKGVPKEGDFLDFNKESDAHKQFLKMSYERRTKKKDDV